MIHHVIMVKKFKEMFYGSYWVNNGIIKKCFGSWFKRTTSEALKYDCFESNDWKLTVWSYDFVDECDLDEYKTIILFYSK